jgi:translation initiation factor 3 subunit A
LHRYTEGFRTVEDIYNILQISQSRRKANPDVPAPKAKLMANYYEKLTTLFWVSENYLFHAFAWYKYYSLCREFNRGMSEDTKQMQASAVLLAALCIPQLPSESGRDSNKQHGIASTMEDDIVKQKMSRMAVLLGFHTRNPTRESLLTEIRSKNILDQVPQYLRDLYYLLEDTSDPLVIVEKARPLLLQLQKEIGATTSTDTDNDDVLDTTLGRYVKPLTSVLLLRLIVNLSAAYHTVSIDHLKKLSSGLGLTFEEVEKSIVQFTQTKALSVRIDHRSGCLRFGDPNLESDSMRSQLTVLSKQLNSVSLILTPPNVAERADDRAEKYKLILSNLDNEHAAILVRKNLIEKRKEESGRLAQEKVREEARIKAEEEAARKVEEEKRIARDQRLREVEKLKKIQQELENTEKKRFLVAMGKKTDDITEAEIAKIDTEALQKEHQDKMNKEREESERKTREAAKKLDYLVRAIRIEELPLVKNKYEEKIKKDRERYEHEISEKAKEAKLQWESDVKDKKTLEEHSVFACFGEFEEKAMAGRKVRHEMLCKEADDEAMVEAERAKIRRARKRKEDEAKYQAEEEAREKEEEDRHREEEEQQKREAARHEKEADEEARRQVEVKRMDDERRKRESEEANGKYVPPSMRNKQGGGGRSDGPSRFGDAGGYPGGGRYEGRSGDSRGGGDRQGGGGYGDRDRGGGGGDRQGGGGYGDRDRGGGGGDRQGGGGYGDRDRGGGGGDRQGGGGYGGRDRASGGGYGDRDRGAGGGGGYGDRGAGGGGGYGGDRRGGTDRGPDRGGQDSRR